MIKPMFVTVIIAGLATGSMLTSGNVFARSSSGHHSGARSVVQAVPVRHHRNFFRPYRRAIFLTPWYYEYGYGPADDVPPPSDQTTAEKRRECEPKSYTVPSGSGGESQVTIIRC